MAKGDNRARFLQLAEKRMVKAIKAIRLVRNLSNRSNYTYTEDEVKKIVKALDAEVKAVRREFENETSPADVEFKL
jgi:hypothetical protein